MSDLRTAFAAAKETAPYALWGGLIGATSFVMLDYLDGNDTSAETAVLGAGIGAFLGSGVALVIKASNDNQIENSVLASPMLGMGATVFGLKAYPKTRGMSNKQLISAGLVGGIVGLGIGSSIYYLT